MIRGPEELVLEEGSGGSQVELRGGQVAMGGWCSSLLSRRCRIGRLL